MSLSDIAIRISASGGAQVEGVLNGIAASVNNLSDHLDAARDKFDNTFAALDKVKNVGIGAMAAGGAMLMLANSMSTAADEGEGVEQRLQSILRAQGRLADYNGIDDMVMKVTVEGHFDDDDGIRDAAVHLASFSVQTQDVEQLLPRVARQARTMGLDLNSVADQMGKAYNDISLDSMKRAGLAFSDQDQKALDAAKSISETAARMEWMRIVSDAVDRNTVSLGDSLTGAAAAANDFKRKQDDLWTEMGKGVNDAKTKLYTFMSGIIDRVMDFEKAHPGVVRAAGTWLAYGGAILVVGGGLLWLAGTVAGAIINISTLVTAFGAMGAAGATGGAAAAGGLMAVATWAAIAAAAVIVLAGAFIVAKAYYDELQKPTETVTDARTGDQQNEDASNAEQVKKKVAEAEGDSGLSAHGKEAVYKAATKKLTDLGATDDAIEMNQKRQALTRSPEYTSTHGSDAAAKQYLDGVGGINGVSSNNSAARLTSVAHPDEPKPDGALGDYAGQVAEQQRQMQAMQQQGPGASSLSTASPGAPGSSGGITTPDPQAATNPGGGYTITIPSFQLPQSDLERQAAQYVARNKR